MREFGWAGNILTCRNGIIAETNFVRLLLKYYDESERQGKFNSVPSAHAFQAARAVAIAAHPLSILLLGSCWWRQTDKMSVGAGGGFVRRVCCAYFILVLYICIYDRLLTLRHFAYTRAVRPYVVHSQPTFKLFVVPDQHRERQTDCRCCRIYKGESSEVSRPLSLSPIH